MSLLVRVFQAVPLAAAMLLAACGGGSGSADGALARAAPTPVVIVDPPPPPPPVVASAEPDTALFVARAQQAICADRSNQVFLIDKKYALLARSGNCGDAAYAYELFGATPDVPLCSKADSIAGPQSSCKDDVLKALFDTMTANLGKADLGLGASHQVQQITFLPRDGTAVEFVIASADGFSGVHQARQIVIKDQATLAAVWREHSGPAPGGAGANDAVNDAVNNANGVGLPRIGAMPVVDFSTSMVIAVFAGDTGCRQFGIRRIHTANGRLLVAVENRDISSVALCVAVVSSPMQMVVVPRSDAGVDFIAFSDERLAYATLPTPRGAHAMTAGERSQLVKDQAAWIALWQVNGGTEAAPALDFSKKMVAAYFLGARPNLCYGLAVSGVFRANGRIGVGLVESIGGLSTICPAAIGFPYVMVVLDRSDEAVEFWRETRQLN